jgi:hypothetical protein
VAAAASGKSSNKFFEQSPGFARGFFYSRIVAALFLVSVALCLLTITAFAMWNDADATGVAPMRNRFTAFLKFHPCHRPDTIAPSSAPTRIMGYEGSVIAQQC